MAVTSVQVKAGVNGFGGTSVVTSFNSAAGTGIIAGYVQWQVTVGTSDLTSVTDDKGNSYTLGTVRTRAGTSVANIYIQPFYVITPITGVVAVTAHFSASTNADFISLHELTSGVFDQDAGTTGSSSSPSSGTITLPSGAFAFSACIFEDGNGAPPNFTATGGWTELLDTGGGVLVYGGEYIAGSGSVTGGPVYSGVFGPGPWAASMLSFKDIRITGLRPAICL